VEKKVKNTKEVKKGGARCWCIDRRYTLVRFKGKVNTLVKSRGRLDFFISSLLIKLFQVLSLWT